MNIEEAIDILEKWFLNRAEEEQKYGYLTIEQIKFKEAIETLLTAYEKEKEKNKEYEKQLDLDYVDNNFVCKDKIKAKIEELKEEFDMGEEWYNKNYIIEVLQSLLEEKE